MKASTETFGRPGREDIFLIECMNIIRYLIEYQLFAICLLLNTDASTHSRIVNGIYRQAEITNESSGISWMIERDIRACWEKPLVRMHLFLMFRRFPIIFQYSCIRKYSEIRVCSTEAQPGASLEHSLECFRIQKYRKRTGNLFNIKNVILFPPNGHQI